MRKPSECANYEEDWRPTSYGSFSKEKTAWFSRDRMAYCCEKCVFNSGVHADFCERKVTHGQVREGVVEGKDC